MHKPESVLENETQKILWDFEVETDPRIPARRPDLVMINQKKKKKKKKKEERKRTRKNGKKENLSNCGFCYSDGPQSENQRKKKKKKRNKY